MTASWPRLNAAEPLRRRAAGLLLAALVQALFIAALLLWAVPPLSRVRPEREVIFHLAPVARPAPPVQVITAPPTRRPMASIPAPSRAAPSNIAPPANIAGFGQSLFGCAPENYASLAPDQRARCTRPGEDMAYNREPDLMGHHPNHVQDEAHWQAEYVRKTSPTMLCPSLSPGCLALMILSGKITDPRTWPHYEVQMYGKGDFYKIEQAYDEWNRQHARRAADCVPEMPPGANRDTVTAARSPCPATRSAPASATSPAHPDLP